MHIIAYVQHTLHIFMLQDNRQTCTIVSAFAGLKNKNPLDSSLPDFVGSDSNACKLSIPTF